MALRYGYFDSEIIGYDSEGMPILDRAESSDLLCLIFAMLLTNGVLAKPSDCFQVIADEGMKLRIKAGFGLVKGHFAYDNEESEIWIPNAPKAYKRIDAVVLRLNNLERVCEIIVKEGVPATNPVAPELIQPTSGDYYELCLAEVQINSNQTAIAQSNITDTRADSSKCGFITQFIDSIDTSVFFTQLNAFYNEYVAKFNGNYADFILKMDSAYQNFYTKLNDLYNTSVDKYEVDYADFADKMKTAYSQYLNDLENYFTTLQNKGYGDMTEIIQRMAEFEVEQEAVWDIWFDSVKGKMEGDVGAKCVLLLENHEARILALEEMLISGEIYAPLATEDGDVLTTESDDVIEAFWYHATK